MRTCMRLSRWGCDVHMCMRMLVFEDAVMRSTTEAEYVALTDAIKEAISMRYVLRVWSFI